MRKPPGKNNPAGRSRIFFLQNRYLNRPQRWRTLENAREENKDYFTLRRQGRKGRKTLRAYKYFKKTGDFNTKTAKVTKKRKNTNQEYYQPPNFVHFVSFVFSIHFNKS
jgi:hypothetical protein